MDLPVQRVDNRPEKILVPSRPGGAGNPQIYQKCIPGPENAGGGMKTLP